MGAENELPSSARAASDLDHRVLSPSPDSFKVHIAEQSCRMSFLLLSVAR